MAEEERLAVALQLGDARVLEDEAECVWRGRRRVDRRVHRGDHEVRDAQVLLGCREQVEVLHVHAGDLARVELVDDGLRQVEHDGDRLLGRRLVRVGEDEVADRAELILVDALELCEVIGVEHGAVRLRESGDLLQDVVEVERARIRLEAAVGVGARHVVVILEKARTCAAVDVLQVADRRRVDLVGVV